MDDIWRALRDPRISTTLTLAVVVLIGFVLLAAGWRGAAATLYVGLQLPWVLSGTFAGIAVVGAGLALFSTHLDRVEAAVERADLELLQREALLLLSEVSARTS